MASQVAFNLVARSQTIEWFVMQGLVELHCLAFWVVATVDSGFQELQGLRMVGRASPNKPVK